MLHRLLAAPVAAAAVLLFATAALAGGFAIANLDSTPGQPRAGESTSIAFTVLQHGVTPWTQGGVSVVARNDTTAEAIRSDARADGKPGHYVATLVFPTAGTWSWEIEMPLVMNSKFAPLQVLPAVAPAQPNSGTADSTAPVSAPAIALGLALALAVLGGFALLRRRPTPATS